MSERLNWSYKVQAVGGPTLAGSGSKDTDSYEKYAVTIPATTGNTATMDVSAGTKTEFVLLTSSAYKDVTYKVGSGSARNLDGPIMLVGTAAAALLGSPINELTFTNNGSTAVTISLFLGRDAIS